MKIKDKTPLSIYIHIPFCVRKCFYCDFLSFEATKEERSLYVEALCMEIERESKKYKNRFVKTIFFGGGTPSLLTSVEVTKIMNCVTSHFLLIENAEITMECNPKTASYEEFCQYIKHGINRLSIGLQSIQDDELEAIGRIHTYKEFLSCYEDARKAGFTNINIDLLSGLPGQSVESYEKTLQTIVGLNPEHISAYSLIIEEGTMFYEWYELQEGNNRLPLLTEDEDRTIYSFTKSFLKEHGYERYEISNYAKKGKECKHNLVYWERLDYVGFGLGASSMVENIRFRNEEDLVAYIDKNQRDLSVIVEEEPLIKEAQIEEFMFLGLRKMEGISKEKFKEIFCHTVDDYFGEQLRELKEKELLEETTESIFLTEQGIDISNQVFLSFLDPRL
ncbi:MAG: radical SAM family heme chaperone HemW [Lachnospiraceae bacterium]